MSTMPSHAEEVRFLARLSAASHDAATSLCCVAYWAGMWSFLDAIAVSKVASGCSAMFLVVLFTVVKAHQRLENCAANMPMAFQVLLVWLWTCFLAVLSLLIWRLGFSAVNMFLLPRDNLHALSAASIGGTILALGGRCRSASCAPPVQVVVDTYLPGFRFPRATYSGHQLGNACFDLLLTIPVVLVWAGIWALLDTLAVPPIRSGVVSFGWILFCSLFSISDLLRARCAGLWPLAPMADVMWTSVMTAACIGVWRGTWEIAFEQLRLSEAPHAAAVFLVGLVGLTLLKRHRSVMFPPVSFMSDDEDYFHAVGSNPFSTEPSEKDPLRQQEGKACEVISSRSAA